MKRVTLSLVVVFALAMVSAAFGQGTPSQSQDPNMQAPGTPSQQTPGAQPSKTPSTSDPTAASPTSTPTSDARSFVGSIKEASGKYVLHTGGTDYQLDDQNQAKKFDGKDVKVIGQLDQSSNTIRVQSIEPSNSM